MTDKEERRNTSWTTGDVIDLEYFFHRDVDADEEALDKRDRRMFVHHIEPILKNHPPDPERANPTAIRLWFERRRQESGRTSEAAGFTPGAAFEEAYRILRIMSVVGGILAGFGCATAVLRYTGTAPINVSVYLAGLLLPQLLLMAALAATYFLPAAFRQERPPSPIYGLIAEMLVRWMKKLSGLMGENISPERRQSVLFAVAFIKGGGGGRRNLIFWPVFILAQLFAVCMNAGILAATLVRVAGTDLAFGWQSTLQLSGKIVHRIVDVIALPWSWLVPAHWAHPSLSQIQGSRMILKEGIVQLTTPDLVAWWPFLCLCILFYGLLPRAGLLAAGVMIRQKRLAALDFNNAACHAVLNRMTTPLVVSGSRLSRQPENSVSSVLPTQQNKAEKEASFLKHDTSSTALIPEDIFERCRDEDLLAHFPHRFSYRGLKMRRVTLNENEDGGVMKELVRQNKGGTPPNVFLLLEAWRPPIKETLDYIKWLRKILGDHVLIYVGLVGRPAGEAVFRPAMDSDWHLWKRKMAALNDPYLQYERVRPHDG